MTQYDKLGSSYNVVDAMPFKTMELQNVQDAIVPLLRPDMKIIEFACGGGLHSERLLTWSPNSTLTSVDISSEMLSVAKARLPAEVASGRVRFVQADGRKPSSLAPDGSQGYFDFAFAGWFLNYAYSKAELVAMFQTISLNLKDDGFFAGVVPHPTETKDALAQRAEGYRHSPLDRVWPLNEYTEEIEGGEGWLVRIHLDNKVNFLTSHMIKSFYEEAAREAGFKGKLEWRREKLLGDDWKAPQKLTPEEWKQRDACPQLAIFMVWKS